jgi:hypothetical protein
VVFRPLVVVQRNLIDKEACTVYALKLSQPREILRSKKSSDSRRWHGMETWYRVKGQLQAFRLCDFDFPLDLVEVLLSALQFPGVLVVKLALLRAGGSVPSHCRTEFGERTLSRQVGRRWF